MTPRPALVPDAIQPLTGYRMWTYVLLGRTATLHSMTCSGPRGCPWAAAPTDWVGSSCYRNDHPWHRPPEEECSCGIHAVPTVDLLLGRFAPLMGDATGQVMGRVELAGKIIEHEYGYRAEKARIAELIALEGTTPDLIGLAAQLGLPVASPVPWPSVETDPLSPSEIDILRRISNGATTREAADSVGISPGRVRKHLDLIFEKLGANAGAQAVAFRPPPDAAA